ncbi:MAG: hypothetical protein DRI57_23165 [Deltaproteobacteria bacterium]|nr:MAG: hypothetical protein DRI57_23165 [Deltaproteobacteria bacterium]
MWPESVFDHRGHREGTEKAQRTAEILLRPLWFPDCPELYVKPQMNADKTCIVKLHRCKVSFF